MEKDPTLESVRPDDPDPPANDVKSGNDPIDPPAEEHQTFVKA